MEQIAALMLIVGCSSDASTCREIPVPTPAYASAADCRNDLTLQMRLTDVQDARLYGACKEVPADIFERSASLDWSLTRGGRLDIDIVDDFEVVASR